mmetsp:Transcript_12150/g.33433  ORF Transcript_12150/g.33433 Transcript_12150/m.33433 type:complete len:83 (-) Transcript_12150:585-833(-)
MPSRVEAIICSTIHEGFLSEGIESGEREIGKRNNNLHRRSNQSKANKSEQNEGEGESCVHLTTICTAQPNTTRIINRKNNPY